MPPAYTTTHPKMSIFKVIFKLLVSTIRQLDITQDNFFISYYLIRNIHISSYLTKLLELDPTVS